MESVKTKRESNLLMVAMPVVVDVATAVILLLFLPALSLRLEQPSGLNALLLVLLYLLFCVGVYFSRKLLPLPGTWRWAPPDWLKDPKLRAVLGFVFAFFMATTFAYQLGYFEAIFQISAGLLEEGSTAAFFVYAPGSWLGFSLLVILVMAFPVDTNVEPDSTVYNGLALLSLIFTNSLLIFAAAQVRAMISGLQLSAGLGLWLAVLAAFCISLLPARAIYQSRQPFLSGWLSYALFLLLATLLAVFQGLP